MINGVQTITGKIYPDNSNKKAQRTYTGNLSDSFTKSTSPVKTSGNVSFKGLFGLFSTRKSQSEPVSLHDPECSKYHNDLAAGAKRVHNSSIPPKNFKNILSSNELLKILPSLLPENYISSEENIKNGVYIADLDYQSNYSQGKESVFTILDDVALFANKYYARTGKDFIFALSDRDSIDGVQHAIRIIGENPSKFEHVKFVPGIKMSFLHKAPRSDIKYENSEMLVYGINPYSEPLIEFTGNTIKNRKEMISEFLTLAAELYPDADYNIIEFAEQNNLDYNKAYTVSNLYWRLKEYVETKGGSKLTGHNVSPEEIINEEADISNNAHKVYQSSDLDSSVGLDSEIVPDDRFNIEIKKLFRKYMPHFDKDKGKIVCKAENLYPDMIECLGQENPKPVLALASPYYYAHYFERDDANRFRSVANYFIKLIDESDGMLKAFESIAPSYELDNVLGQETVDKFNNYIRKKPELQDLYEVGGSFASIKK